MSIPLSNLDFNSFTLGGTDLTAVLQAFKPEAQNTIQDGSGLADDFEFGIAVKQKQTIAFQILTLNGSSIPSSGLDISVWSVEGTSYLGQLRGGTISASLKTPERSSIASAYMVPGATKRNVEFTSDFLVVSSAGFTKTLMTGGQASFNVVVQVTYGGIAFSCPMILKGSVHSVTNNEMQMENVSMSARGAATGPGGGSPLGEILFGSALLTLASDSGGNEYNTTSALLTKVNVAFADSSLIKIDGTLEIQGALTVV